MAHAVQDTVINLRNDCQERSETALNQQLEMQGARVSLEVEAKSLQGRKKLLEKILEEKETTIAELQHNLHETKNAAGMPCSIGVPFHLLGDCRPI